MKQQMQQQPLSDTRYRMLLSETQQFFKNPTPTSLWALVILSPIPKNIKLSYVNWINTS